MVRNPLSRKEKDLPPATLTSEEFDEMLREHFDMKVVRMRGISKEDCDTIGGVVVPGEGGDSVCYVPVHKNVENPDITVIRKIKIEEA